MSMGSVLAGARDLSLLYNVCSSGAHPAPYTKGTRAVSPRVKCQWHETDHTPLADAEVKNGGAISPLPDSETLI
jgi:hypothetical protein